MTTSGTFAYDPTLGNLIIQAFGRIGVRRTELLASHMDDGRTAANLTFTEWSNRAPSLWTVRQIDVPLTSGTATYACSTPVIQIMDMWINNGYSDRILSAISRSDYAAISVKTTQGPPTTYWFDRQIDPSITFWPVPNQSGYTARYFCVRQFEDADLATGQTLDLPYRFFDAFVASLAWRLAKTYRPEVADMLAQDAERAWQIAATQDTENVPMYITPDLSGYWR